MAVLADREIQQMISIGELGIVPFDQKNLTPNGYDLSIAEIFIKSSDAHILEGTASIPAQTWFAICTKEFIEMGPQLASQLWIRSSYARRGIMAAFGKVDAGFHGTLTISCFNANDTAVEIPIGDRFCQIVFEQLSSVPKELYEKRSGTYQHQRGVTLNR